MGEVIDFLEKKEEILERKLAHCIEENFRRNNTVELSELADKLAELNPENAYVHFANARIQFCDEKYHKALRFVDEGLSLYSSNKSGLLIKAYTLSFCTDFKGNLLYPEELRKTINLLISVYPEDAGVLNQASGFYLNDLSDSVNALRCAKKASELDPHYIQDCQDTLKEIRKLRLFY